MVVLNFTLKSRFPVAPHFSLQKLTAGAMQVYRTLLWDNQRARMNSVAP
jgi:hypothetical protein